MLLLSVQLRSQSGLGLRLLSVRRGVWFGFLGFLGNGTRFLFWSRRLIWPFATLM